MEIFRDVSLKKYNSFGCDCRAQKVIHVVSEHEAESALSDESPLLVLGSGTNMLFTKDFRGTIIRPDIQGINFEEGDAGDVLVSAGAGIIWDDLVRVCIERGLGGIENLSLIPGTVGAAPVQNIGAYGIEACESIVQVRAINIDSGEWRTFFNNECEFGYRDSIFKNTEKGKWIITQVTFRLQREWHLNLEYGSLRQEAGNGADLNPALVREAVIRIRRSKLPDPSVTGNAGSFFRNPIVEDIIAEQLKSAYHDLPVYRDQSGNPKLAAGWLIEKCGWKGRRIGDAGVHEQQALVLVNLGNASGNEIFELSEEIRKSVFDKFGVLLEREVDVV